MFDSMEYLRHAITIRQLKQLKKKKTVPTSFLKIGKLLHFGTFIEEEAENKVRSAETKIAEPNPAERL